METDQTELLRSLLSLDRVLQLDQVLELNRVLELYRVQSAALRRHRRRELLQRAARRRQYLRRRRAFVLSSVSAALSLLSGTSRLVWVRDRLPGQNLWAAAEAFDDDEWKAQFRVSRATFDFLLELIGPAIKRRRTNYRAPIAPRRRLAVALWWFARSGEYRTIADMFAVGVATVCMIVRQVSSAIVELLLQRFVSLPSGARLDASLRAFRERGYPQCGGALGSTHIPIAPPRQNPDHYRNSSGWHSVILQAAVDHDGCFTNVYAGWPGSSSSAAVLSSSDLYLKAEDRTDGYLFPPERSLLSEGVEIPVHLIGDASFPLKPWLMKGYGAEQQLSSERRRFTAALGLARRVADEAFARLTGRWRCLLKKSELDVSVTPRVAVACCVLHNVCERRGDHFLPEWSVEAAPNRPTQPHGDVFEADAYCTAEVIRDTITYNLLAMLQR